MSSEVVDVLTGELLSGELIHELDESEARALTDRIVHSTTLAAALVAGTGITVTVNDGADSITIAATSSTDEAQVALISQVFGG